MILMLTFPSMFFDHFLERCDAKNKFFIKHRGRVSVVVQFEAALLEIIKNEASTLVKTARLEKYWNPLVGDAARTVVICDEAMSTV